MAPASSSFFSAFFELEEFADEGAADLVVDGIKALHVLIVGVRSCETKSLPANQN